MASMNPELAIAIAGSTVRCFGPFSINVPIPYSNVTLNSGSGYKPSMGRAAEIKIYSLRNEKHVTNPSLLSVGVFTALSPGIYVFSYTVYSSVDVNGQLNHKVNSDFTAFIAHLL